MELIIVFYKHSWKKAQNGQNDITRQEFISWTNGLWIFQGESKKRVGHPAPYPLELPRRCIKMFSFVGDRILDPFVGSGTTIIEAIKNNRSAIGIEISEKYTNLAKARIRQCLETAN